MRLGVCGGIDRIKKAAECGLDYIEPAFKMLALSDEKEYYNFGNELAKCSLGCEAANGFLPPEIKITGKSVDYNYLEKYLHTGYERAARLGVKTVVLGAGGARYVENGYSYHDAVLDVVKFVKLYAAPAADEYNINFVFEPLCKPETNIINTVKEGGLLAASINMKNVAVLADLFHMYVEGDTYDDIRELKGMIKHAHISNPLSNTTGMKRCYMKNADEFDYKGFFDALNYAGCERISIEADTNDFESDIIKAVEILKMYNISEEK